MHIPSTVLIRLLNYLQSELSGPDGARSRQDQWTTAGTGTARDRAYSSERTTSSLYSIDLYVEHVHSLL